jgi:hypothetical protein
MYLALIAGPNWHSMQRPLYGLLALVLLVTGLGLYWLAITLRRLHIRLNTEKSMDSPLTTPIPLSGLKSTRTSLSKLVILLLGLLVGYMIIRVEHHSSSYDRELAAWKVNHQTVQAQYQKDRAAWKALMPKEE